MFETITLPQNITSEKELLQFVADRHRTDMETAEELIPHVSDVPRPTFKEYPCVLAKSGDRITAHARDPHSLRIVPIPLQNWPKGTAVAIRTRDESRPIGMQALITRRVAEIRAARA